MGPRSRIYAVSSYSWGLSILRSHKWAHLPPTLKYDCDNSSFGISCPLTEIIGLQSYKGYLKHRSRAASFRRKKKGNTSTLQNGFQMVPVVLSLWPWGFQPAHLSARHIPRCHFPGAALLQKTWHGHGAAGLTGWCDPPAAPRPLQGAAKDKETEAILGKDATLAWFNPIYFNDKMTKKSGQK